MKVLHNTTISNGKVISEVTGTFSIMQEEIENGVFHQWMTDEGYMMISNQEYAKMDNGFLVIQSLIEKQQGA